MYISVVCTPVRARATSRHNIFNVKEKRRCLQTFDEEQLCLSFLFYAQSIFIHWLVFSIRITVRARVAFNEYYLESRVAFNEAPCPRLSVPRWCSFPVCCTYYVTLTGHTRTPGTGLGDPGPLIGQIISSPASHWSGPGCYCRG